MNTQTSTQRQAVSTKRGSRRTKQKPCQPFSIYFAGDLWDHKDLIGNAMLADYIEKRSQGRYRCVLPQNLEQAINRAVDVRNQDLKMVMTCDLCLFNFDGHELDSGTVVEFMYAKLLDLPSLVLRTDFRSAGDSGKDGDPWNLMVSNWPRTRILKLHGMAEYQGASRASRDVNATIERLYTKIADQVIENLDAVRCEPVLASRHFLRAMYKWAVNFPGGGLQELFAERELEGLIAGKRAKGLL